MMSGMLPGRRKSSSGQSLVEYVMLMVVVVGMAKLLTSQLPSFLKKIEGPFKDQFARTYKYGDPQACGYEGDPPVCSGTPERHPRYKETSRMFARGVSQ